MSLVKVQWEFTQDIAKLIEFAAKNSVILTFGEAYRTKDQQRLYYYGYEIDLTDKKIGFIKTKRKSMTLQSNHLKRLAVDFNIFVNGRLTYKKEDTQFLGDFWESLREGNRWGGNFNSFIDVPHFERVY